MFGWGKKKSDKAIPVLNGKSTRPVNVEQVRAGDVIFTATGQRYTVLATIPSVTQGGWSGSVPATELYLGDEMVRYPNGSTIQVEE